MESVKHQIEYKRLDEIRPYDNNPRRNDEAAKAVANSIKEFGFQSPIIVDRDGVIIAGHTRYKAARRLKLQEVPVIVAAELDPEKVKALRIADNSTGEVAEWDLQLLVQELTGIEYDMTDFGLNLQIKIDEEVKEDDFTAEPPEQPITQRGDIWLLGDHRVMCGDSTSPQDVERLMDGQLADLLLTDPPYNVNYQGSNGKKIENDNMAESQFRQFLLQAYSRAFDACRTGASAYIFHADTEGEAFRAMFREIQESFHQLDDETQQAEMGRYTARHQMDLLDYIYDHFDVFRLLLDGAHGTRFACFLDELVDIEVEYTYQYMEVIGCESVKSGQVTEEFIHIIVTAYFNGMFEVVRHNMDRAAAHRYVKMLNDYHMAGFSTVFDPQP